MLCNIIGSIVDSRKWSFLTFLWSPSLKNLILQEIKKTKKEKRGEKLAQFLTKKATIGPMFETTIYIYIYAVELKTGPIFAFSSVKNWSNFFVFFVFLFLKISFSLQKEEDFSKKEEKQTKTKTPFLALKTGPICCATYLDQFLTLAWTSF